MHNWNNFNFSWNKIEISVQANITEVFVQLNECMYVAWEIYAKFILLVLLPSELLPIAHMSQGNLKAMQN